MVRADGFDVEDDAVRVGMLAGSKMTQSRWRGTCFSSSIANPVQPPGQNLPLPICWSVQKYTLRCVKTSKKMWKKCTEIYCAVCQNPPKIYLVIGGHVLCNLAKSSQIHCVMKLPSSLLTIVSPAAFQHIPPSPPVSQHSTKLKIYSSLGFFEFSILVLVNLFWSVEAYPIWSTQKCQICALGN